MAEHFFRVAPRHPRATQDQYVWRCERCDSEVLFHKGAGEKMVNTMMIAKLPCVPKDALN